MTGWPPTGPAPLYPAWAWHRDARSVTRAAEASSAHVRAVEDFVVRGNVHRALCTHCGVVTRMVVDGGAMLGEHINLREGLVCEGCGLNARARLLLHACDTVFPRRDARIALLEAFSGLSTIAAAKWPQVSCSEFFGGEARPGEQASRVTANGVVRSARHEDLTALSYADASLDGIVHNDVLEHVPDTGAALAQMLRVLRPGGCAVFTMPWFPWREATTVRGRIRADGSLERLLPDEFHGDGLREEGIYTFYNFGADFGRMLADAGFDDIRFGVCYAPCCGFFSNNFRYGLDGLMLPTTIVARRPVPTPSSMEST